MSIRCWGGSTIDKNQRRHRGSGGPYYLFPFSRPQLTVVQDLMDDLRNAFKEVSREISAVTA
jgi:hypothetical protein